MSFDPFPYRTSEPELTGSIVKFVGGAAAVTKLFGKALAVNYVGTGIVNLVWKENPGAFVGVLGHCFEATVHAGVKGYTVVAGVYNPATFTLQIQIFNSAFALADLAALQWLTIVLGFKYASQTGNAAI